MRKLTVAIVYYESIKLDYFYKSIYSALAQLYNDFEIIIYSETLSFKTNLNIKIVSVPDEYIGIPSKVREFIVKNTTTEYLAFWDSDDVFTIDRLTKQMEIVEKQNCDLCFSNFGFFNNEKMYKEDFFTLVGFKNRNIDIIDENYVGLGISIVKTAFLKKLLPFPNIKTLDWWIAIKSKYLEAKIEYSEEILGYYRIYSDSSSLVFEGVDIDAIKQEIENKINLYNEFDSSYEEIKNRYNYFNEIKKNINFDEIKKEYNSNKYKNIWGGIVKYKNSFTEKK